MILENLPAMLIAIAALHLEFSSSVPSSLLSLSLELPLLLLFTIVACSAAPVLTSSPVCLYSRFPH